MNWELDLKIKRMRWLTRYIILFVLVCCRGTMLAEEVTRSPGADFLEKYRNDANFDYERDMSAAPGLWDWIKRWILERLFRMKWSDSSSQVMDHFTYKISEEFGFQKEGRGTFCRGYGRL